MSAPAGLGLNDLSGETTLQAARESLDFPVYTPAYPPDLGDPDRVFVQDIGGPLVVLVWTDSAEADRAVLSLHILGPGVVGMKGPPPILAETEVNGSYALWTSGPYLLNYRGFHQPLALVVEGQVLIWEAHGLTYRLETDLPLEEAIRIGESLGE
jgi:hypothetical protein